MKTICVCTSYPADREPRAPRHARALAEVTGAKLAFIDAAPAGAPRVDVQPLCEISDLTWLTHYYAHRKCGVFHLTFDRLMSAGARFLFHIAGQLRTCALSPALRGFEKAIRSSRPDLIMAHNIDTLLPAYRVAKELGARLVFDSMEFHSDMGESQTSIEKDLIASIERLCLPACQLITTSSHRVAEALRESYGVRNVLPLYNTPPCRPTLGEMKVSGFALYWRNSTLGIGQRGLADALAALRSLPAEVTLHIQGRLPPDGGQQINSLARQLGVGNRLVVHPPYAPGRAVEEAAKFHVGLCLEQKGNRNHELTVSNKMFDYHMAGLPVVSSDLPALRDIVGRSQGGLLFRAGDVEHLARTIRQLYDDSSLYHRLAVNARDFAMTYGNLEHEMNTFKGAISQILDEGDGATVPSHASGSRRVTASPVDA